MEINTHSVGDSLKSLKRNYYKSSKNIKNNQISIHLISSDFCTNGKIITFKISNEYIESMKLIILD